MKKINLKFVSGSLLLIFSAFCFYFYQNITEVEVIMDDAVNNELKFRGILVPGGKDKCPVDGVCSFVVGDIEVVWAQGWPREVVGSTGDDRLNVGDEVEVYAKKTGEKSATLYGSEDYYIKKLNKK